MSTEVLKYPRPIRVLSKANLLASWLNSRDSTKKSGAPGLDKVTARSYASKLDFNINNLAWRIREGHFHFSKLRPNPIPKPGQAKDRVICIPTVEDRLVQRTMAAYFHKSKLFPIYNEVSFGFIPEVGTKKALSEVLNLRREFDHVFETDISAFFDTIDRDMLISKVRRVLGKHSLVPLLEQVIKKEIKETRECSKKKLENLGIMAGKGLRQGMPLSPMLANLALAEFDAAVLRRGIRMVRYADDIVVFATTKRSALEAGRFVQERLEALGHSIPQIGNDSKTRVATKFEPFQFLGREIIFSEREGDFVQRVPKSKISKMKSAILDLSDLQRLLEDNSTFPDVSNKITQKAASFIASYSDAHNAMHVENEMKIARVEALKKIYSQVFGQSAMDAVNSKHLQFLGLKVPSMETGDFEYTY